MDWVDCEPFVIFMVDPFTADVATDPPERAVDVPSYDPKTDKIVVNVVGRVIVATVLALMDCFPHCSAKSPGHLW